jgi:hypothetical protein
MGGHSFEGFVVVERLVEHELALVKLPLDDLEVEDVDSVAVVGSVVVAELVCWQ